MILRKKVVTAFAAALMATAFISCSQDAGSDTNSNNADQTTNTDDDSLQTGTPTDTELEEATIFVVGDSTVCDYIKADGTLTDATYYYPRYGYATQFDKFFSSKLKVNNLALSGRSSKSFLLEENYTTLKNSIKKGDYLVIGFGHNDEKSDDETRFASALLSTDTEGSFKYNLYNYYCKIALDKGATPIICSPVVRANSKNDYTGSYAHITDNGDYSKAVIELGEEKSIQTVDLTSLTKAKYEEIGYDEAVYFHAMTSGTSTDNGVTVTPKVESVDTTHLNIYGAKYVSYLFAKAISQSDCSLKAYVTSLTEPTKADTLVVNPDYKWSAYTAPDLQNYSPVAHFTTITEGWYGTAFGDTGGTPDAVSTDGSSTNGYYATETSEGTFKVGCEKSKGKFSSNSEGFAYAFRQVSVSRNFTLTAKAKVTASASSKQAGFGLMLRDNCYLPANDKTLLGNHVTAGIYQAEASMNINFFRSSEAALSYTSDTVSGMYAADDEATFTIKRLGQVVNITTEYKGKTYTYTHTDFDFVAKDNDYMYIGMFANRGTLVEFTDVTFTDDGESQGA